ncbi:MAG: helix-turn-helix domain-containing protein [Nanoarchaeota archaeon]
METSILQELGLNEIEIKVYLELLKSESLLASEIASRLNLHRTTSYYILSNLIKKGLVSYIIKSGKKYFIATNPEKLLEIEKEREIKIKSLIPELINLKKPLEKIPLVEVYEGKEGLKTIWEDILKSLNKNQEISILATGKTPKLLPYYLPNFHNRRIKQIIKLKIIYNDLEESKKRGKELAKMKFTQVKYLSKDYLMPSSTLIYGEKIAFMLWNENKIIGILIYDKDMNKSFQSYFNLLWKIAK